MKMPTIHISPAARLAIQEAATQAAGNPLKITINVRGGLEYDLRFVSPTDRDLAVDCDGLTVLLDRSTAGLADGMSLDFKSDGGGAGFSIENPNPAPSIRQLSAAAVKAMIDSGTPFELIDVRTESEREIARIDGSRLLYQPCHDYLLGLDRATPIVFTCHHGMRSQAAAEYFLREGFRQLHNLEGGIDAWSQSVDPAVPRY